ncbi:MFS transporter [Bordetella genomosp. 6]|uniref:MFS transporter n=1 Tax=Bordetella genomosp. 6 TaxID=463024 RepID=A0ABX4F7T4_9BORD|nr:MFS transporter [Bordetella genomosp. 6]OZI70177.1 MFS transporter [Bordetella genomosp. 6]
MIPARAVVCLGISQLIGWGISFYLIGNFGPAIQAETGWSAADVYGGFSGAIICMALASPPGGRAIDRWGGHRVMPVGAILMSLGCLGLAASHHLAAYYAAWAILGVGMRLCLYDAAFAALARIGGVRARAAMSQITLFGGLASTMLWPAGQAMAAAWGWRGAVCAYAALALAIIPLYRALPARAHPPAPEDAQPGMPPPRAPGTRIDQALYALVAMLSNFLTAGNATHLIALLTGLGQSAQAAVGIAALWGMGQVGARLLEVLFGRRLHPMLLNTLTSAALPLCFLAGLAGGHYAAAAAFTLCYGACNGLLTITRGTLPLVLFEPRRYGALVGRLLVPGFLLTAAAPSAYAWIIGYGGPRAAMALSASCALAILLASLWLARRYRGRGAAARAPSALPRGR